MLADDISGRRYSKAEHRRALLSLLNDGSEGSVEFKHQNVSAVLKGLGEDWIPGYKPAFNFQMTLVDAVARWLALNPAWLGRQPGLQPAAGLRLRSAGSDQGCGDLRWRRRGARRRDKKAALKFLKKAMRRHAKQETIVTDKLRSYGAALKEIGAGFRQDTSRWANNRAENSHLPFRRRERAMLRFRHMRSLQTFAYVHASVTNHFNSDRSLSSRANFKLNRPACSSRATRFGPHGMMQIRSAPTHEIHGTSRFAS
ncbi:DDE-type integrase/transposase/recombinase [Citreimonas sp.]|uniref:DDE-type integrase/transposase/recombinase n=1 Tax=Citreimonas sp. TaxID=3036715 RepID=UPI0035C86D43